MRGMMPMFMMLLLVGGGIIAYTKRCEWFKICDTPKFKQGAVPRFVDQKASIDAGTIKYAPGAKVVDDLEVTVPQEDGSLKVFNPQSKFARISYW